MNDRPFDQAADSAASYFFAVAMMRLRMLLDGDRHPQPDEEVDIVLWAQCERTRGAGVSAE